MLHSKIKKYIRYNLKINGPAVTEICKGKKKVDYNYRNNFLYELEKSFIKNS